MNFKFFLLNALYLSASEFEVKIITGSTAGKAFPPQHLADWMNRAPVVMGAVPRSHEIVFAAKMEFVHVKPN